MAGQEKAKTAPAEPPDDRTVPLARGPPVDAGRLPLLHLAGGRYHGGAALPPFGDMGPHHHREPLTLCGRRFRAHRRSFRGRIGEFLLVSLA